MIVEYEWYEYIKRVTYSNLLPDKALLELKYFDSDAWIQIWETE